MAKFFIYRPVFAWVIAILIMMAGILSINSLPVSQYPDIAPPTISISASYPGASSEVVENSVIQPIEQSLTGLDGLLYMSSSSQSSGRGSISLTFQSGIDADISQVQVQNKIQRAITSLPKEVQEQGVSVSKSSSNFLMVLGFISTDGTMNNNDISDYVSSNLAEKISRIDGVGSIQVFGSEYAMRIWLDPIKLASYKLSTQDIVSAINAENAQIALGQLGGTPAIDGQSITATITAQSKMETVEEFENIVLNSDGDGGHVLLSDVAKIEKGADNYGFVTRYNRNPASGLSISLATGANALETSENVKKFIEEQSAFFPEGLESVIPFDTTPFVKVSIDGVIHTMIEAFVLVFIVMFLFLQNFRATLIPTIAIPVVLLGTFGVLAVMGYSINMLTMFAMVLAIGLLVDDAIVVVENVERIMREEGLSPKEATVKSMGQITGALIGIGVVLSAVFIPMAFMSGSAGVIYRQFSVTIVSAMVLSVLVALVLTPALCATMLKPIKKGDNHEAKGFFGWFNRSFSKSSKAYERGVMGIANRSKRFMLIFAIICGLMVYLFNNLPSSFLPDEDQGSLISQVMAPAGTTQEETMKTIYKVEDIFLDEEKESVESIFTIQGFSFSGSGQNMGMAFIKLKDWDERKDDSLSAQSTAGRVMGSLSQIKEAMVFAFSLPPMPALGISTGVSFYLTDNAGLGRDVLQESRNQFLGMANQNANLQNFRPNGMEDNPQLKVNIDREKASTLGVSITEINNTLSLAWGGRYIDDFMDRGRIKKVYVQSDASYRMNPDDFNQWKIKNKDGDMVPFSSFATTEWDFGSPQLVRYNSVAALEIQGEGIQGISTGEVMSTVESIVNQLPDGIGVEWTGMSYQEREAGNQVFYLYALSIIVVFLCLAALYESWIVPTAVLMVAPLGIIGTMTAAWIMGMSQDIYFQVAMLTTVGIASRNAILMIEFAKSHYEAGMSLMESASEAARDRIRPIIMTSLAFGLGVLPMAISTGAGSGAQNAIGIGVLGGMIASTFLGIFFIPLFFIVIQRTFGKKPSQKSGEV